MSKKLFGASVTLLLRDGAEPMEVLEAKSFLTAVTTIRWRAETGEWVPWVSFVHCGPAAPFPAVSGDPITRDKWWGVLR